MLLELLIGAFIGIPGVIGIATWRLLRHRLEDDFHRLRARAAKDLKFRQLDDRDAALRGPLDELHVRTDQLGTLGFVALGDLVDDDQAVPTRWFVDAERTTFAMFGIANHRLGGMMVSYDPERAFITAVPRTPKLAAPSSIVRSDVVQTTSFADMFAKHRQVVDRATSILRVDDIDQAVGAVLTIRARSRAWRDAQPEAALLDADVQSYLGRDYQHRGPWLKRRLARAIPTAKVVSGLR